MAIVLNIEQEMEAPAGIDDALQLAANSLLKNMQIRHAELSILLTGDETMQRLNQQFRLEEKSTDVLSFPAMDEPPAISEEIGYLGDIAISIPIAQKQAAMQGHSTTAELQLLLLHGILHLLGYDHNSEEEKSLMWSLQRQALENLGLAGVEPTEK